MEVNVHPESSADKGCNCLLRSPDRGLILASWLAVESVEVLAESIKAVITSRNPVRVESGNHLKHKVFP